MTLVYPDTSVLVSAHVEEAFSVLAEGWLATLRPGEFASSDWCETEIASAVAAKARAGYVTRENRPRLLATIYAVLDESATFIAIQPRHFKSAANLLSRSTLPLGSGDALHLAIAADAGATLFTLDRRMTDAGIALGLDVHLLI